MKGSWEKPKTEKLSWWNWSLAYKMNRENKKTENQNSQHSAQNRLNTRTATLKEHSAQNRLSAEGRFGSSNLTRGSLVCAPTNRGNAGKLPGKTGKTGFCSVWRGKPALAQAKPALAQTKQQAENVLALLGEATMRTASKKVRLHTRSINKLLSQYLTDFKSKWGRR